MSKLDANDIKNTFAQEVQANIFPNIDIWHFIILCCKIIFNEND